MTLFRLSLAMLKVALLLRLPPDSRFPKAESLHPSRSFNPVLSLVAISCLRLNHRLRFCLRLRLSKLPTRFSVVLLNLHSIRFKHLTRLCLVSQEQHRFCHRRIHNFCLRTTSRFLVGRRLPNREVAFLHCQIHSPLHRRSQVTLPPLMREVVIGRWPTVGPMQIQLGPVKRGLD